MRTLVLASLMALAATAAGAQEVALPGGASALNERHGDWSVSCSVGDAGKSCALSQAVRSARNGAPMMAVELSVPAAERAEGMMLTAFGLRLRDGVQLGIDGAELGEALAFLTCVSSGCVVPVRFDEATIALLKAGTKLQITGVKVEDSQPVTIEMSLSGFTAAYERTAALAQ